MKGLMRTFKTACVLGFIFLSLAFLLNTQTGSTLTLRIASFLTHQDFKFSSLKGRLLDNTVTLHNVVYRTETWSASAETLIIYWEPKALLKKTFWIKDMRIDNIHVMQDNKVFMNIPEITGDFRLNKKMLTTLFIETGIPEIPHMTLFTEGSLSDYSWKISLLGKQTDWEISGVGDKQKIIFTTSLPKLLNNRVDMAGSINWSPNLTWDITLKAKELHATLFDKKLSGTVFLHSIMDDEHVTPEDETPNLFALIKNAYLEIDTQIHLDQAHLTLKGKLTNRWNIDYTFYPGELKNFTPNFSGKIGSSGTITGQKFQPILEAKLSAHELSFNAFPDTTLKSQLDIHAKANLHPKQPSALSLRTNIHFLTIDHFIDEKKIQLSSDGLFNLNLDKNGLHSHLALFFYQQKNNAVDFVLHFPKLDSWRTPKEDEPLKGELNLSIHQFSFLQLLSPNITNVHGTLKSDVKINGRLNNPTFSGGGSIDNMSFYLPDLAIKPTANITLKTHDNLLNYSGHISSGEGKIVLDGKTVFSEDLSTQISIKGENFLLSNLLKNKLTISPDVQLKNHEDQWQIKGRIFIPKAYLDFGDTRTTATLPAHAIVISPEGKILKHETLQLMTQLDVVAGNDVTLIFNGLTGKLRGNLLLENTESQLIANGLITLNGAYDLMGEELFIQDGVLSFNHSPIENPALNLRGSKKILLNNMTHNFTNPETLTVGVLVQGTAQNPHISLFSDPAGWSQSDILSLIILGEPASSVSGTDAQLLFKAAQLMSPQKGSTLNKLKAQLQQTFGLTDLRIESGLTNADAEDTDAAQKSTSVVVGKSLTPRLYISYSVSIFNALNTFRMKYLLGKHWFVQTQTNTAGSGVDLFYTVEK